MKVCTKCRRTAFESDFYNNKANKSRLDNYCKECRKKDVCLRRHKFKHPIRFIKPARILISQGKLICACCGNKNEKWLQLDHIIPVKSRKRYNLATISRKIVLGLVSPQDYQLLCANCNFAKSDLEKCPIDHSLD